MQKDFVKILKQKNLGYYHGFHLKSDVFETFRKKCLEMDS